MTDVNTSYRSEDVLAEGDHQEGIRWLVLRGPFEAPVAYVGIPIDSAAAGLNTDFLDESGAPSPHGGWTYNGAGDGLHRPDGWYWWGWDYAHLGDWCRGMDERGGHRWTTDEVVAQVRALLPDFEAWLRSHPEQGATDEAYKGPPTIDELWAQLKQLQELEGAAGGR